MSGPAGVAGLARLDRSRALHDRARAMIRAFASGSVMPEAFDALAVDLVRFQADHVEGYARLCAARGVDLASITRASQAPAVPADAFRIARVFAFGQSDGDGHVAVTFRTSGTTATAAAGRGAHAMRDAGTYDEAALAFGRAMLGGDIDRISSPHPVLVVGPSGEEAPDSSLSHMCSLFARRFGPREPDDRVYFVRGGALRTSALRDRIAELPASRPAIVLATSFALVHLLDELPPGEALPLPPRSRVMQTGGFKGRSREVSPEALRAAVARAFAVDERSVIAEYGMTELSSQFWEGTLVDDRVPHGVFREPPWARVVAVDPETLAPVPDGAAGIARIEDLANVDSAFAILTQDRVVRVEGGFRLLGRSPGATARGCSIALDEMLGGGDERG